MILLSNRHFCVAKIAKIFDTREATVRRWIERFEQDHRVDLPVALHVTDFGRSGSQPLRGEHLV